MKPLNLAKLRVVSAFIHIYIWYALNNTGLRVNYTAISTRGHQQWSDSSSDGH